MKKISKKFLKEIADNIWDSGEQIIELKSMVPEVIRRLDSSLGELESNDISEKYLLKIIDFLHTKYIEAQKLGLTPNYEFSGHSDDRLIRFSYAKQEDPLLVSKLELRSDISDAIKKMDWPSFERFCKFILEQFGVTTSHTKLTRDGGVDFYGIMKLNRYIGFLSSIELKIFGQAKHKTNKNVSEDEMDAFIRKYDECKKGVGKALSKLRPWFKTSKGQIYGVYVTNSNFEKGAIDSAEREGIVILNGSQVAEEVAKLKGDYPWFYYINDRYTFDKDKFIEFFKK